MRSRSCAHALLADCKFEQAIALYDKAIEKNPYVPAYYCNRAFAHLKTESYGYALADANKSIELDPNFIKVTARAGRRAGTARWKSDAVVPPPPCCGRWPRQAYYRRASANMALLRFKDALRDLKAVRAPARLCHTPGESDLMRAKRPVPWVASRRWCNAHRATPTPGRSWRKSKRL